MKHITSEVEVSVGSGPDKKVFKGPVSYHELETAEDVRPFLDDKAKLTELIDAANYGFNLKARSKVRQTLIAESAGPDNAVAKLIKSIVANRAAVGRPISEVEARNLAMVTLGMDTQETPAAPESEEVTEEANA